MSEIERVLRPGGYVCIIAPSAGPQHGGNTPIVTFFMKRA